MFFKAEIHLNEVHQYVYTVDVMLFEGQFYLRLLGNKFLNQRGNYDFAYPNFTYFNFGLVRNALYNSAVMTVGH